MDTHKKINFIMIHRDLKNYVRNCRSYQSPYMGYVHTLGIVNLIISFEINKRRQKQNHVSKLYNVQKISSNEGLMKEIEITIGLQFALLMDNSYEYTDEHYEEYIKILHKKT